MIESLSEDMALFLWAILHVPVLISIAAATLFALLFILASMFNFLLKRRA